MSRCDGCNKGIGPSDVFMEAAVQYRYCLDCLIPMMVKPDGSVVDISKQLVLS